MIDNNCVFIENNICTCLTTTQCVNCNFYKSKNDYIRIVDGKKQYVVEKSKIKK